ncbi:alpha/beta fold hydrolase [Streptacidiphilus sp. 4-A2]|nr:alpha/beta fold hydrolase [Streptacidiphilus sp. 4-A2]
MVVLVLHGGHEHSLAPVRGWSLPALRMRPFTSRLRRALAGRDATVLPVRYRVRGWNGDRADAAVDARAAVDRAARRPDRPRIVLVGHSMGGRAALAAAGHPQVTAVVVLAPWTPPGEPVAHLAGRTVHILHAPGDRVTDPGESRDFAERARAAGARSFWEPVPSDHAMLRNARTWHARTVAAVLAVTDGDDTG